MDEITYNGKRFTRFGNYFRSSRKFLHRAIWEDANGPIPKGYHIHHKDHDRGNNALENLEIVHGAEHLSRHHKGHGRRPDAALVALVEWRKTDAGKTFHHEMGKRNEHFLRQKKEFICECCGSKFTTEPHGRNRFCSNACRAKQRRRDGADRVSATCQVCGTQYLTSRFKPSQTCSCSCGRKLWIATPAGKEHIARLASASRRPK